MLPRPIQPACRGFTLLELIVVLLLLSLAAAVAVPALRGFAAGRQTEDAAAEMVALTQYARAQAAAQGRPYRLNFDLTARTYWLTAQTQGTYNRLDTTYGRSFKLPDEATFTWEAPNDITTRNYIQFNPNGSNEVATLRLTGAAGHGARVTCSSPTEPYRMVAFGRGGGG